MIINKKKKRKKDDRNKLYEKEMKIKAMNS